MSISKKYKEDPFILRVILLKKWLILRYFLSICEIFILKTTIQWLLNFKQFIFLQTFFESLLIKAWQFNNLNKSSLWLFIDLTYIFRNIFLNIISEKICEILIIALLGLRNRSHTLINLWLLITFLKLFY